MVNRFRSLGWTSVAALALTIPAASDSSNSPGQGQGAQAPDQRPVFKTEANYVRVDVYPTVDGHPVLDLRQDELQLLEDGVPQKIDAFEHVMIRPAGPQETRREQSSGKRAAVSTFLKQNTRCRTPLPRTHQAAMLWPMWDMLRTPVCPPLLRSSYRCTHETLHQLQTCRVAQACRS